jgi:hypothetical protein
MGALIGELVPPPPRTSARYAMLGVVGIVLLGGAAAAVLRRGPPEELVPLDNKGVQPLIDQLNKSESERRLLLTQINQQKMDHQELVVLRDKLIVKDQEIQKLIEKVTELTQRPIIKPTNRPPSQAVLVTAAVAQAETDLEGCFHEWSERVKGDADLLVKLTVTPEGIGHSSTATGPESEFLRLCVAEATQRVKYPAGSEVLELEVNIQWSEGLLNLAARVVGRRQPPSSMLDL